MIILGDFNVDLLKVNEHKITNSFYNCLISHHLLPVITRPTRITDHSSTLIDNLFTNAWPKLIDSSIIASDISDHMPIIARFDLEVVRYGNFTHSNRRIINDERKESFADTLASLDWTSVIESCEGRGEHGL